MGVVNIERVGEHLGQEVTIRGWLYNMRESGKLVFPIFRDGTGILQGVCALKENPEAFAGAEGSHSGIQRDRYRHDSRRTARSRRL